MSDVLVHVIRGERVESRHHGDAVVVDTAGKVHWSAGDPHRFTFWRSAAKPILLMPLIAAGGVERFSLTPAEIAVMASSHSGEQRHIEVVSGILAKIGLDAEALQCGLAPPINARVAKELMKSGQSGTSLHNPCSGKHTGMLALARIKGWPIEDYLKPEHPVQRTMLQSVAEVVGMEPGKISLGVDGCGVPVYGLPISRMARAYARLAEPQSLMPPLRQAARVIREAMRAEPFFIGGTGRLETDLMTVTRGRLLGKGGAEGVFNMGIPDKGLGICIKIDDGNHRATGPAAVRLLQRLGLLSEAEIDQVKNHLQPRLTNHRGEEIGYLEAVLT